MDNQGVYLIGAFHEMVELLERTGTPVIGLIDTRMPPDAVCQRHPLAGDDEWLLSRGPSQDLPGLVISPDSPKIREKLFQKFEKMGFQFPVINGGEVSKDSEIGAASVIQVKSFISAGCRIGCGVKINVGALVMHDSQVGDFTTVAPAAVVLGRVTVGKCVYIGANATLLPGVRIGDGAVIGAGAVVTKDVAPMAVVKGVPAR